MIKRSAAVVLVLCAATGCVRYTRADAALEPGRFAPLWERDLSAFEQRIAVDRHTGTDDDWTQLAQTWLDFVNCAELEPPAKLQLTDPLAQWLRATLVAEDLRRSLAIFRDATGADAALHTEVAATGFFQRDGEAVGSDFIQWPAREEGWVDEVPSRRPVASQCATLRERVVMTKLRADDAESPTRNFQDWLLAYFEATERATLLFAALPEAQRAGAPASLAWRSQMWVAALAHETAAAWQAFADAARIKAEKGVSAEENLARMENGNTRATELRARAHATLTPVVAEVPDDIEPSERARAQLLLAWYELGAERSGRALELLAAARADGLDDENFWAARYLELRVASDAARWETAVELANGLPPSTSRYHGAYFYRVAVAAKRTQHEERFLNIAMKAFRDRPYKSDPFLRALYWEMLQTLAEYPFDARVIEMLEDMGPRGQTAERVEEYARTALDRGRAANADAAARWLLGRQTDQRFHPRYHGIIALAAFVDDDVKRFASAASNVTSRPAKVTDALPTRRQPAFFAHADAELARLLRQMLPVMAEWGEDRASQDRRQRWLRVIVAAAQDFLRDTEDTLARPQLLELYRLASKLLDDHPRGYAERVGEEEPAPLVLGTVRVERRTLDDAEPVVELQMRAPYSLTLIPRDELAASQWPQRWPKEQAP